MTTHVERLAAHAASMHACTLPARIRRRVDTFLLYNLTMAMAGHDPDDPAWRALRSLPSAPGRASVMATGEHIAAADAAFANAALVTARGQNDTLKEIHGHLGCMVIPAVLALAQERSLSMETVTAAIAAGYEVQAHAGSGVATAAVRRGFRASSVFGVLGASAAAARVLGLAPAQTAHALAIACNFAGGVMQCWAEGSMEWRLQVAHASRSGVVAALLAEAGMTGASLALEGPAGLYHALGSPTPVLDLATWKLEDVTFKPYPGCAINQGPVHSLLSILDRAGIASEDVTGIDVHLTPAQADYPGVANYGPFRSPAGAVMSTGFMMAAALRDRALRQRHFSEEYACPALNASSRAVVLKRDPDLADGTSRILVHLRNGTQLAETCIDAENFVFDWDQTVRLVETVSREIPGPDGLERIRRLADALGNAAVATVDELLALCAPRPAAHC